MRTQLKWHGPRETLCNTCGRCSIRQDQNNDVTVYCHAFKVRLNKSVIECGDYEMKGTMAKWEMEERAWILEVKKGGQIGFKKPGEDR